MTALFITSRALTRETRGSLGARARAIGLGFSFLALVAIPPASAQAVAERPAVPAPASPVVTSLADAADRFVEEGDLRIRYRMIGPEAGEPVVLLHGFWGSLLDWRTIADSLARDHRVLALDARGMGQSSRFADPARYGAHMLDDVARVMDHAGVARAHVVGFSLGGVTAAGFALRHPSRVKSLVMAGAHFWDSTAFAARTASWVEGLEDGRGISVMFKSVYHDISDSLANAVNERVMRTNDARALAAVLRNFPAFVPPWRAATIAVPSTAIVGTADVFVDETTGLARHWPAARIVTVEGVHHGGILRHVQLLAAIRERTAAR